MRFTRKRLATLGGVVALAAAVVVPVALATNYAGSLVTFDQQMKGRLFRDGVASTCHGKANPGLAENTGLRSYDRYRFQNSTNQTQCVHVFMKHNCLVAGAKVNAFAQANTVFIPGDPSHNYLGDAGQSGSPPDFPAQSFSFSVSAGSPYDVVVGQVSHGSINCTYNLNVTVGAGEDPTPLVATAVLKGAVDTRS